MEKDPMTMTIKRYPHTCTVNVYDKDAFTYRPLLTREEAEPWLEALRSDKYKRGDCHLCQVTKKGITRHCCLGVLCEIHGTNKVMKQPTSGSSLSCGVKLYALYGYGPRQRDTLLPTTDDLYPKLSGTGEFHGFTLLMSRAARGTRRADQWSDDSLASMNDHGAPFKLIADVIEKLMTEPKSTKTNDTSKRKTANTQGTAL